MLLGHDQKMHWCRRIDIVKGQHIVVFVNDFRWYLLGRDLAENTVAHAGLFIGKNKRKEIRKVISVAVLFAFNQFAIGFFLDTGNALASRQFIEHLLRRQIELRQHDQGMEPEVGAFIQHL
jgi:hypothetical protein